MTNAPPSEPDGAWITVSLPASAAQEAAGFALSQTSALCAASVVPTHALPSARSPLPWQQPESAFASVAAGIAIAVMFAARSTKVPFARCTPVSVLHEDLAATVFADEHDEAQLFSADAAMVFAPEQLLAHDDFIEICSTFAPEHEALSPQDAAL